MSWLYARGRGGTFIVRVEDTDSARSRDEHVTEILDGFRWLGLDWDELVFQSANLDAHRRAVQQLLDSGHAYRDAATPEQVTAFKQAHPGRGYRGTPSPDGTGVVRLRMPERPISFSDEVRGELTVDPAGLHDEVLARADGSPLYNLAVVVDDHDAQITHVIRAEDHITNTFKQVAIGEALGYPTPVYAHLSLIHAPDGRKYSKRHQAPGVEELRAQGFTPRTVRNYLALLGWGPRDNQELLADAELMARFDLADCVKGAARFDPDKLRWMSGQTLRALPVRDFAAELAEFTGWPADEKLLHAAAASQEKASTLEDARKLLAYAYTDEVVFDAKAWRKTMKDTTSAHVYLGTIANSLPEITAWEPAEIKRVLDLCVPHLAKPGKVFQPLRVALTGSTVSPAIEQTVYLLDPQVVRARIRKTIEMLAWQVVRGEDPVTGEKLPAA